MAAHQRIHPFPDLETPPPSSKSPKSHHLFAGDLHSLPPPHAGIHPLPPSLSSFLRRRLKTPCCVCAAISCLVCLAILAIILTVLSMLIAFPIFSPQLPTYSLHSLRFAPFSPALAANNSLSVTFSVRNPNPSLGIHYLAGSRLTAWYGPTLLYQGAFPDFYQAAGNSTAITLPLAGSVANATALGIPTSGKVSLDLKGSVPIKVGVGNLKMMKMGIEVRCELSVDDLFSHHDHHDYNVRIGSSSCETTKN